jgi:hypothetical protein
MIVWHFVVALCSWNPFSAAISMKHHDPSLKPDKQRADTRLASGLWPVNALRKRCGGVADGAIL